jgi:hypothetical protein
MLNILAIKEMQIKMVLRFYLTPVERLSSTKEPITNADTDVGDEGRKKPSYTVGGNVN